MTPERRAEIRAHLDQIVTTRWRGEGPAERLAEIDRFMGGLRARGEATDPAVMSAAHAARTRIDAERRGL